MFKVFPNPANNILNVQLEKHTNGTFTLFDMNGKVVLSQVVSGDFAQINISSLSAGNYVLWLVENGQVSAEVKIVKEHFILLVRKPAPFPLERAISIDTLQFLFVGRCPTLMIIALSGRRRQSAGSRKSISTGHHPVEW
ncbi:MAG: T9SS type A sorting domain-containing protein [Prolixibacteraceae bacterium]|nr:T9SS type A sorting domain-containing protein [Prolixibacteraceae bacterium]